MSEKPEQFERPPIAIVGNADEKTKNELREKIQAKFREGLLPEISSSAIKRMAEFSVKIERKKSPHEIEFIRTANDLINMLRKEHGMETFQVSPNNLHVVSSDFMEETGFPGDTTGVQDIKNQIILINERALKHPSFAARAIVHELTHLMGYVAFEVTDKSTESTDTGDSYTDETSEDGSRWTWDTYRVGIVTNGTYKKYKESGQHQENFRGIEEAIVAEIEDRLSREVISRSKNPKVTEELTWLNSQAAKRYAEEIAKNADIPVSEVVWVNKNQNSNNELAILKPYRNERMLLHYIAEQIAEDEECEKEVIIDKFVKAHFTGNIVEIARLINRVFGDKLTFRTIGMMRGGDDQITTQMLEYLKKRRLIAKSSRVNN